MAVSRPRWHGVDQVTPRERRRETIAESTARLMDHAKRNGWGEVEGLPTMSGDCLIFHFTSGRRGIVRLPQNSHYGEKDT